MKIHSQMRCSFTKKNTQVKLGERHEHTNATERKRGKQTKTEDEQKTMISKLRKLHGENKIPEEFAAIDTKQRERENA